MKRLTAIRGSGASEVVRITRQNEREVIFDPMIASCRTNEAIFVPNRPETWLRFYFR